MEEFSVLRTPGYPKYHGSLSQPHCRERSMTYYEPIYDRDLKIPGLGIATLPFVPIQHIRSSKGSRPYVPRYLTEEDMIQINIRAQQKARDIMKDFHPAQKASYESATDFRLKKDIESRIEDIRESCANAHQYYRKAGKYDFTRQNVYIPRLPERYVDKDNLKDIVLESKFEHIKDMKKKLGEDRDNHRAKFRLHAAGCKEEPKKVGILEEIEATNEQEPKENSVVPEQPSNEAASTPSGRRSSRDTRAEQLKVLEERIKKQESASDCFERTFGRHLSKLRGEVNELTHMTDNYIGDSRYRSFSVDRAMRKY